MTDNKDSLAEEGLQVVAYWDGNGWRSLTYSFHPKQIGWVVGKRRIWPSGQPTELERELTAVLRELIAFYTRALVLTKIDHGAMEKARAVLSKATERGL